jgi:ABC-type branched-subunit amino acid transport system substrate-binding protein
VRRRRWAPIALSLCIGISVTYVATAQAASDAAPAPITVALVTSLTGPAATEFATDPAGFRARIDLQNAMGGVNGHKLVPLVIDDQTSPTEVVTAVNQAISKGAVGIVSTSALFFLAAKIAHQAGIPVTGTYSDGQEWGQQPYTNMFSSDEGSLNPTLPVNTLEGKLLKMFGGTNAGVYGYSISPSSTREADAVDQSFKHAGGKVPVLDTTLPFGDVNFTGEALVAKQDHINAIYPTMEGSSNFALATAMKQAGVHMKAAIFSVGYDPTVIGSPAWSNLQGDYFLSLYRPFSLPNSGTEQMAAALQKYQHFSKKQFPTPFQYEAWAGADLLIKGIQKAGGSPTRAKIISALRGEKSYNADGLLPNPIDYATIFGHDLPKTCVWVLKAQSTGFSPVSSQPVCGTDIPGTSTVGDS